MEDLAKQTPQEFPDGAPVTQQSLIRYFVTSLVDEDEQISKSAAALLLRRHIELAPAVIEALGSEGYSARSRATWALLAGTHTARDYDQAIGALGPLIPNVIEMAEREIKEARRETNEAGRKTTVQDIGRGLTASWLGTLLGQSNATEKHRERALPVLKELLNDESYYVRNRTMRGLVRMGPAAKPLVPVLVERLLNDREPVNRSSAIAVLASIGPDAKGVVPALINALDDRRTYGPARMALRRIDPDALNAALENRGNKPEARRSDRNETDQ